MMKLLEHWDMRPLIMIIKTEFNDFSPYYSISSDIWKSNFFLQESVWVDEVFTNACEGKQMILDEK